MLVDTQRIDENEPVRREIELTFEPSLAHAQDVGAILLGGVARPLPPDRVAAKAALLRG